MPRRTDRPKTCVHCGKRRAQRRRQLCPACFALPGVLEQHEPTASEDYHEPTEAELDAMIAEQLPTMPNGKSTD